MKAIIFIALLFCFSCIHTQKHNTGNNPLIIDVQPFTGIPASQVQYVYSELKKIYPYIQLKVPIPLPPGAYTAARNRYRADSLINYLSNTTTDGHVTIGLTATDISTTKNNVPDWGVMGLGFCPGKACVASTFRLTEKDKLAQLFKVSIHELGHTEGLPHCPVTTCFMRDAEGRNPINEEKDFCEKCKVFLITKGWQFSTAQ